jgi:hypothetical protein
MGGSVNDYIFLVKIKYPYEENVLFLLDKPMN